jgi:HK97 family phage major capsid protein
MAAPFNIGGFPLVVSSRTLDIGPGSTPVFFGNLDETHLLITRKAVTVQNDPYAFGYCAGFKFESRVGGAIVSPNAARSLRIR